MTVAGKVHWLGLAKLGVAAEVLQEGTGGHLAK